MSEEEGDKKKVSIGDALEAIRSGKPTGAPKKMLAQTPRRRMGRPTAAFWIRNLQESIERRMDHLYTSIKDNPGARSQMMRRDFYATERFTIPVDVVQEVAELDSVTKQPIGPTTLARFTDVDQVQGDLSKVQRSAQIADHQTKNGQLAGALEGVGSEFLAGHLQSDSSQRKAGSLNANDRFGNVDNLDLGPLIFEEVKCAPLHRPKKLKVNPMIRKMFEKRNDS